MRDGGLEKDLLTIRPGDDYYETCEKLGLSENDYMQEEQIEITTDYDDPVAYISRGNTENRQIEIIRFILKFSSEDDDDEILNKVLKKIDWDEEEMAEKDMCNPYLIEDIDEDDFYYGVADKYYIWSESMTDYYLLHSSNMDVWFLDISNYDANYY